MLGYCMECKKLVSCQFVRASVGPFPDVKPILHSAPGGEKCDGHKKAIR